MKTLNYITCKRCGCTSSSMWVDPQELIESHSCLDGVRPDPDPEHFVVAERVVSGSGERGKDDEVPADDRERR